MFFNEDGEPTGGSDAGAEETPATGDADAGSDDASVGTPAPADGANADA